VPVLVWLIALLCVHVQSPSKLQGELVQLEQQLAEIELLTKNEELGQVQKQQRLDDWNMVRTLCQVPNEAPRDPPRQLCLHMLRCCSSCCTA
jgi:hypothetical protein